MTSHTVLCWIRVLIIVCFYDEIDTGVMASGVSSLPKKILRNKSEDFTVDKGRKMQLRVC